VQEPLRTILLFVAQLRSRLVPDSMGRRAIHELHHLLGRAQSALISGALQLRAGLRAGAGIFDHQFEDVLTRAVRDCGRCPRNRRFLTHDPLPAVKAQGGQIETVLRNLIGNALKYRGDQPPRLHIGVERQENAWKISVRDNGRGFKPEYAGHIFGVFKRLHGSEVPAPESD